MKKLIIVLALICISNIGYGKDFNGQELLEDCRYATMSADDLISKLDKTDKDGAIKIIAGRYSCIALISGFVAGHGAIVAVAPKSKGVFCVPDGSDAGMWVRVVYRFLEKHPELLHENWDVLILKALVVAYPCK